MNDAVWCYDYCINFVFSLAGILFA